MAKSNSVKLTNDIREKIMENIAKATFKDRRAALQLQKNSVVGEVISALIGSTNLSLMKQLPPEYFYNQFDFRFYSAGSVGLVSISVSEPIRVPAVYQYGTIELPATSGFWKKLRAVSAAQKALYDDEEALVEKARSLLMAVTTVKALLESWPEVEPFLPEIAAKKELPAIRVDEINAMILKARG